MRLVSAIRTKDTAIMATATPKTGTLNRRAADDRQSTLGYLAQGAGFIGFLLILFILAGFRG